MILQANDERQSFEATKSMRIYSSVSPSFASGRRRAVYRCGAAIAVVCLLSAIKLHAAAPVGWPMPFYDAQSSSVSPCRGDIVNPRLAWTHSLGLGRPDSVVPSRPPSVRHDLNGDGFAEKIVVDKAGKRFTVSDGAGGQELWSTETEQAIYSPMFSVADANADGKLDLCLVTHYRAEIYDAESGKRLHRISWDVGRNYGLSVWSNFDGDPQAECLILSGYTAHADFLDVGPGDRARHVWSTIYRHKKDENAAWDFAVGRRDLRYLYRSVGDFDGDGDFEAAFMVFNLKDRRRWRTLLRALPDGRLLSEREDLFLYGVEDANGDGRSELFAAELHTYGMKSFGALSVWNLQKGGLHKTCDLGRGRFVLAKDHLPAYAASSSVRGSEDKTVLVDDFTGDGRREFLVERDGNADGLADAYEVTRLDTDGQVTVVATFADPESRLTPSHVESRKNCAALHGYDLVSQESVVFGPDGRVTRRPGVRSTTFRSQPVVGDLDGDGRCEIVVQNADGWIEVLDVSVAGGAPVLRWRRRGWGMNRHSGYNRPGAGVVLADLEGDGKFEVIFAGISSEGWASLTVADRHGKTIWEHATVRVTQDWPDCGVDKWTVGRLNDDNVLDCVVQYHDLGHSSTRLRALDGKTGRPIWDRFETNLSGTKRPMSGTFPVLVRNERSGTDDVVLMPEQGVSVLAGSTGEPITAVRFWPPEPGQPDLWHPQGSNAPYATEMSASDVDGDGVPEIFFNDRLTQAGLRLWPKVEQLWVVGEVHPAATAVTFRAEDNPLLFDFDGDGRAEFCAVHAKERLVVHDAMTGVVEDEFRLPATPTTKVAVADVDGDGRPDLLYGAGTTIHAVATASGKERHLRELWSFALPTTIGNPILVNLGGEGHSAVLVPTIDARLHCLVGR